MVINVICTQYEYIFIFKLYFLTNNRAADVLPITRLGMTMYARRATPSPCLASVI